MIVEKSSRKELVSLQSIPSFSEPRHRGHSKVKTLIQASLFNCIRPRATSKD